MLPSNETVDSRAGPGMPDRAERLEMLFAVWSQGLGSCPAWLVTELGDCERADHASVMSGDGRVMDKGRIRVEG